MSESTATELKALLEGAGMAVLGDRAFIEAKGPDASRWLNGMTTNNVQALAPGEGVYSFFLNAQGRIQGDATIYREPNADRDASFYIFTTHDQAQTIQPMLDRFIIMDDVELIAANDNDLYSLVLAGPKADDIFRAILPGIEAPASLQLVAGPEKSLIYSPAGSGVRRIEIFSDPSVVGPLAEAALQRGATPLTVAKGTDVFEALRILEGTPLFGVDIRDRDLPQETAQSHALHFSKGCYLGQEIVERIRSRGQVHRLFTAFRLDGSLPVSFPTPLEANGKPAGELTSAMEVPLPSGAARLALGYARREALDTGATFTYSGGTAQPRKPGLAA